MVRATEVKEVGAMEEGGGGGVEKGEGEQHSHFERARRSLLAGARPSVLNLAAMQVVSKVSSHRLI